MSTDSSNPILRRLGVAGVGDERHFIRMATHVWHLESQRTAAPFKVRTMPVRDRLQPTPVLPPGAKEA